MYLFVLSFIDYMKCVQQTKYVDWDVKTVTAGDYTVEFDIDQAFYDQFATSFLDENSPIPEAMQFKLFIKEELERRLSVMPSLGYEHNDERIKIGLITFAYNNA